MNKILLLALVFTIGACASKKGAQVNNSPTQNLKLAWEIKDGIDTPESAYYDEDSKTLFLSQVAGTPNVQDGKGWIVAATAEGKIIDKQWYKGLNAPKGMRSHNGLLWVTDINRVIAINIKTKKVARNIKINSAKFLNDIAISKDGTIYVSDMFANRIFTIGKNGVALFAQGESLESPNGLLIKDNFIYVAGWGMGIKADFSTTAPGHLYMMDLKTKMKVKITTLPLGNLDGLEFKNDGYLVSDWMKGVVYEINAKGESKVLIENFKGSADIGYIKSSNLLIVPRMNEGVVSAYQL